MEEKNEIISIESKEIQPQEIANFASNAAKVLKEIVTSAKTSIKISGNEYLKFEAWQTIAKFYNTTVTVEWTKPVHQFTADGKDVTVGYEARANVIDKTGRIIGSAESSCTREEKTWSNRADFQIRSMAQTRACAKALRQVFAWVVVLSGYQGTPAEEMDGIENVVTTQAKPVPRETGYKCYKCNKDLNENIYQFSMDKFNTPLCFEHQKEARDIIEKSAPKKKKAAEVVEEEVVENGN